MKSIQVAYGFVLAAYASWGVLPIFWALLSTEDPVTVLFQRTMWSALLLGAVLLCRGEFISACRSLISWRQLRATCLSTLCLGLNWFLYVWAMKERQLFAASLAYYICPLFTMAGAALVFKERFSTRQKLALLFLISGVALPAIVGGALPVLAIFIAASWSAYTLTRRYYNRPALQALFVETLSLAGALIVLLPLCFEESALLPVHAGRALVGLFILSGVVTAVPILLMIEGMKLVPLGAVGMLQYLTPTLMFVCSRFYLGANTTPEQWAALGLVWVGLLVFFSEQLLRIGSICVMQVTGLWQKLCLAGRTKKEEARSLFKLGPVAAPVANRVSLDELRWAGKPLRDTEAGVRRTMLK